MMTLLELQEQIQNDLLTYFDGVLLYEFHEQAMDGMCDIIVLNIGEYSQENQLNK